MKYAVMGAGIVGEQFLLEHWDKIKIEEIFDNNKKGIFHGWQIKKPEYKENLFIIVASNNYYDIRKQLIALGYSEFSDFVPYQIFRKKMAIVYGNCHIHAIKEYLECHKEFAGDYGFYPFPAIQLIGVLEDYDRILPHCELFIHQSIRKENKFGEKYASENIIKFLSKQCQVISIPNLYRMPKCFFPQQKLDSRKGEKGVFQFISGKDENIEIWLQQGKTEEDIKKYMVEGGVYKREEILEMWKQFQNKILEREKGWDIKISDYIFDNYKKKKLFYERVHISNVLIKQIAIRLLGYMGYTGDIICEPVNLMDNREMFIYQDVVEALGLEFEQKYIRTTQGWNSVNKCEMDIDEYIRQLCRWVMMPK